MAKEKGRQSKPTPLPDPVLEVFGQGATRTAGCPSFSLIPIEGLVAIARRFELGVPLHSPWSVPDAQRPPNWQQGMPVDVIIDHAIHHLMLLKDGIYEDDLSSTAADTCPSDHIGAVGWAACALAWTAAHRPTLFRRRKTP